MTYTKPLPRIDNILRLSQLARPFPKTAGMVLDIAETWDFSSNTIGFLKLFPEGEVFESDDDLLTRCDELELMIREERKMPAEILHSPQG